LEVAQEMESNLDCSPSTSRSIVNRAYYAVFLSVSIYLLGYGANAYKDHKDAYKDFKKSGVNKRSNGKLAVKYGRLKVLRRLADYHMNPSSSQNSPGISKFDMKIAKKAVFWANDLIGSVTP